MQFDGENYDEISDFIDEKYKYRDYDEDGFPIYRIHTLEGVMTVSLGDYIIKGIKGEIYLCKPDIFKASYKGQEK